MNNEMPEMPKEIDVYLPSPEYANIEGLFMACVESGKGHDRERMGYTRTDLTYPKHLVDELIEAAKERYESQGIRTSLATWNKANERWEKAIIKLRGEHE